MACIPVLPSPFNVNESWTVLERVGVGTFGDVRRMVCSATNTSYALKIINLNRPTSASSAKWAKKETGILEILSHRNVVKFYQAFTLNYGNYLYHCIVLELVSGGELFHQIRPDVGMPIDRARRYFNQIMDGVEYIHSQGIAHRDLKPENILISCASNEENFPTIKISDFGLATIFRFRNKERMLNKECGSLAYMAPEVKRGFYYAQPADIWSVGVVLTMMLKGTKPWTKATDHSEKYVQWVKQEINDVSPWNQMDTFTLAFLQKLLNPIPGDRLTIPQIREEPWCCCKYLNAGKISSPPPQPAKEEKLEVLTRMCSFTSNSFSSPATSPNTPPQHFPPYSTVVIQYQPPPVMGILQTTMYIANQTQTLVPIANQNLLYCTRITRLFVRTDIDETISRLVEVFHTLGWKWTFNGQRIMTVFTFEKQKVTLRVTLFKAQSQVLIDFQLLTGCPLEYKRHVNRIRESPKIAEVLIAKPSGNASNSPRV